MAARVAATLLSAPFRSLCQLFGGSPPGFGGPLDLAREYSVHKGEAHITSKCRGPYARIGLLLPVSRSIPTQSEISQQCVGFHFSKRSTVVISAPGNCSRTVLSTDPVPWKSTRILGLLALSCNGTTPFPLSARMKQSIPSAYMFCCSVATCTVAHIFDRNASGYFSIYSTQ